MRQSLNIKSTREAKVGMELLDTNIRVLPLLQSIPVVSYKYKDQPNGSEIKSQIGILAEDTFYQANPAETNTPFNPPPGGGTALSGFSYQPLGKIRTYTPNSSIKYTLNTGINTLDKKSTYLKAILDQADKGQNIVSSVGLLLKGIQEITDRVMCLENQVLGDDFISEWAKQVGGWPSEIDELNELDSKGINQKVTPFGLSRVVKALSKNVFGNANPSYTQLETITGDGSLAEIKDIKNRLQKLEGDVNTITNKLGEINTSLSNINTAVDGIKTVTDNVNGYLITGFSTSNTLWKMISGMPEAVNTKLISQGTPEKPSLLDKVQAAITNAVTNIKGNPGATLQSINSYLSKMINNTQPMVGNLTGTAKITTTTGNPWSGKIEFVKAENNDKNPQITFDTSNDGTPLPFITINTP